MDNNQLAEAIAKGLVETGVEGGYDALSCSSAGDYPSMGMSQWEGIGGRGDTLLSYIEGGDRFAGRTYSDIINSGQEQELKDLLSSEQGMAAQDMILAQDCLDAYVPSLDIEGFTNDACKVFAGIWCPTSDYVVHKFIVNSITRGYDVNNLEELRDVFINQYWIAADVGEDFYEGYKNRANNTYNYVVSL